MRTLLLTILIAGCCPEGTDMTVQETMAHAVSDLDFAWCAKDRECRSVESSYCGGFSLDALCDRYVNCDLVLTVEQVEAFDVCISEVSELTCDRMYSPTSCQMALGLN